LGIETSSDGALNRFVEVTTEDTAASVVALIAWVTRDGQEGALVRFDAISFFLMYNKDDLGV
jgi:hypothetical protein